jgi:hypothetical protein
VLTSGHILTSTKRTSPSKCGSTSATLDLEALWELPSYRKR